MESETQYKDWLSVGFGSLLFISEILPYISKIKSNGILQIFIDTSKKFFKTSSYQPLPLNEVDNQVSNHIISQPRDVRSNQNINDNTQISIQDNLSVDLNSLELVDKNILANKLDKIIELLEQSQMNSKSMSVVHYNNNVYPTPPLDKIE